MQSAQKFTVKGQIDKAIGEYQKLLKEDPNDVRTILKIGDLFAKMGNNETAIENYVTVAHHYASQGFYMKAIAVFKQILKINNTLIHINIELGEMYQNLGLLTEAMGQYQLVANYYEEKGEVYKSLETLKKMANLDPLNVESRITLAELYSRQGMTKEAIDEFQSAATFLKKENRMEEYAKVLERLVYHNPSHLAVIKELARYYLQEGYIKRALGKLQVLFKSHSKDIETLEMMVEAFQSIDQPSKVIVILKEVAEIQKDFGDHDAYLNAYKRILQLAPNDADALAAIQGIQPNANQNQVSEPIHEEEITVDETPQETIQIPKKETPFSQTFDHDQIDELSQIPSSEKVIINQVLAEAEVYVKYQLLDKALAHITSNLENVSHRFPLYEKLKEIYVKQKKLSELPPVLSYLFDHYWEQKNYTLVQNILKDFEMYAKTNREYLQRLEKWEQLAKTGEKGTATFDNDYLEGSIEPDSIEIMDDGEEADLEEISIEEISDEVVESDILEKAHVLSAQQKPIKQAQQSKDIRQESGTDSGHIKLSKLSAQVASIMDLDDLDEHAFNEEHAEQDVNNLFEKFKNGIRNSLSDEDADTHFDLGVAYKEMGMVEGAIEEFKIAMRTQKRSAEAKYMIGLCHVQSSKFQEAIVYFRQALETPGLSDDETINIFYELGITHKYLEEDHDAKLWLEKVKSLNPHFRDIEQELSSLSITPSEIESFEEVDVSDMLESLDAEIDIDDESSQLEIVEISEEVSTRSSMVSSNKPDSYASATETKNEILPTEESAPSAISIPPETQPPAAMKTDVPIVVEKENISSAHKQAVSPQKKRKISYL